MPEKALGTFWNDLEPIQRGEFKAIFQDLFQDSYTRMVLDFLKREEILYPKEHMEQGRALVKTTIVRTNDKIPVDYFLAPVEEEWMVYDVEIDGVSIVKNYRRSFTRVIKRESFDSLLDRMRLQQKTIKRDSCK